MPSPNNLEQWMSQLLPHAGPCAQHAGARLLRSMLAGFTCVLAQIARQADGEGESATRVRYQLFARWLRRPHWDPETLYAGLNRRARRLLAHRRHVPLLMDITDLSDRWAVLQLSLPWERRALPLFRAVTRETDPEVQRRELVRQACAFVRAHLPGRWSRYLLVADRGFPGHWLVRELEAKGWRFALRVTEAWKVTHPEFTGTLAEAAGVAGLVGPRPRLLREAVLGRRGKGANEWSVAHLVLYHGVGEKDPWYLVTTEERPWQVVAWYRERMRIECEFRDLKGPFGLDTLARWEERERVARFLAMVAVYEWRLADLWVRHRLRRFRASFTKYGRLSWIRITREWIQRQLRAAAQPALARL